MEQQYEDRLSTDKMLPLIIKMAVPVVIAQLVNLLYSLIDRVYIGRIPGCGTQALAGIGMTSSIIILIAAFSAIVAGGGAPLASIALGSGDRKRAGKVLGNGLTLLMILSIVTSLFTYIYMEPILRVMGASDNYIGYAIEYLQIYLLGTFFVMVSTGLNPFINAQGRPGIGMASVLIGAICNIILDPIFIFVFHLGVKGAGIATVISQGLSAMWVLGFLCSKKASLRIERKNMKPDKKIMISMLTLGSSSFVMTSTESLIGFVLNNRLAQYGDIYVSTLTILQSAMQMVGVPVSGFGQGYTPVISYNYGKRNAKRVQEGFRVALAIMFGFMFISVILMMIFRRAIAGIFTEDEELIMQVCRALPVFMSGMTIFGLQRTCQTTFVALGQAKVSMFIALLRKIILLIPLSFIMSELCGVMGVYMAEGIADATAAIICTIIFSMQFPKILQKCKAS